MEDLSNESGGDRYLIFELGSELFATPLIEVRSVIEYQAAKPIPHTAPYYKGVINIRGEIVGVIDLRERLNITGTKNPTSQLVYETKIGALAATVDKVLAVTSFKDDELDRTISAKTEVDGRAYFLGVAKHGGQLLTVISLPKLSVAQSVTN